MCEFLQKFCILQRTGLWQFEQIIISRSLAQNFEKQFCDEKTPLLERNRRKIGFCLISYLPR